MEAFNVPGELLKLLTTYPNAQDIVDAAKRGGSVSKTAIARLWLSEGIPYAFKDNPALYESIRTWLSIKLSVEAKDIHLTGSARLGQSLAPKKLGNAFGGHSDLDIFIISAHLFAQVTKEFNSWAELFETKSITPRNPTEHSYWIENLQRGRQNINKGFLNSNMVPNRSQFKTASEIAQSMWLLKSKLEVTDNAPVIKGASVRCYNNWNSFVRQTVLSLS